jgi:putative restriction endonuclease
MRDHILKLFDELTIWQSGDQRAPHKPLLVLYALGRLARGGPAEIPFAEAATDLTDLLKEFGPSRKSHHPEYPFWRLQNDGVWTVRADGELTARKGNTDPKKSELLAHDARGGFSPDVLAALRADPRLAGEVATRLLDGHFPQSLHEDILAAVGLDIETAAATRRRRDPKFRQRVLVAYEYRCAVCGFDVRLGAVPVALDAAHVRWHQAGGPDAEDNGLALCSLHHKLLDLGAYTVSPQGVVLVSDQATGTDGFAEALMRHHSKPVREAQRPEWRPRPDHLDWHGREVFKGRARHIG